MAPGRLWTTIRQPAFGKNEKPYESRGVGRRRCRSFHCLVLAKAGHEVIVIDRQAQAGVETSYANGGQISVSQSEPWANPGTPMRALKWMSKEDAPLLFRWRFDSRQWSWALKFLTECRPGRAKQNIRQLLNLGLYSRRTLQDLRAETGIHYDEQTRGIPAIYQPSKRWTKRPTPVC